MQDIHSIGGGGGRLFGGGGDRRLRPHNHQNHQALKCPRCDSLNTKFCYYNNYNLSQPRHFCKSCRRYWTKGGVLRNVPVGGGCRKSKRSKPKSSNSANPPAVEISLPETKSHSHSSSESSSLTASTTAAAAGTSATATAEVVSASTSNSGSNLLQFPDSSFFIPPTTTAGIDHPTDGQIFPEIGTFTSMMTTSNDPGLIGFNVADISAYGRYHQSEQEGPPAAMVENQSSNQQQWGQQLQPESKMLVGPTTAAEEQKMEDMAAGFLNQTAEIDFSRAGNSGLATIDWHNGGEGGGSGGEQGFFDLTGTVDQAYWNQTQWPENDHSLNFLP